MLERSTANNPRSLNLSTQFRSEDDEESESTVEQKDGVRNQVPLVLHVEVVLEEARCRECGPRDDKEGEEDAAEVAQIEEDGAERQTAEWQQRVTENAHGRVKLHVHALFGQQVNQQVQEEAS